MKVVAYQRTDHNEYLTREKDRLEAEAIAHEKHVREIEERTRLKEYKLNKNANDRAARKNRIEMEAKAEEDAILNEELEAQRLEEEEAEH